MRIMAVGADMCKGQSDMGRPSAQYSPYADKLNDVNGQKVPLFAHVSGIVSRPTAQGQ